jgi:hypothetical protein
LYALQTNFVFIDLLGLANSTNGLVYALIGGVDTILGPLLGAAILRALTDQLSRAGTQSSLFIGIMLMLVVYLIPDGVLGLWRRFLKRRAGTPGEQRVEAPEAVSAGLTAENVEALQQRLQYLARNLRGVHDAHAIFRRNTQSSSSAGLLRSLGAGRVLESGRQPARGRADQPTRRCCQADHRIRGSHLGTRRGRGYHRARGSGCSNRHAHQSRRPGRCHRRGRNRRCVDARQHRPGGAAD